MVSSPENDRPLVDLRIDMAAPLPSEGGDAVRDLRRVCDAYKPLMPYYAEYGSTIQRGECRRVSRPGRLIEAGPLQRKVSIR